MTILFKLIKQPPENKLTLTIPLSQPQDYPVLPSFQEMNYFFPEDEEKYEDHVNSITSGNIDIDFIRRLVIYFTVQKYNSLESAIFNVLYYTSQKYLFMNYDSENSMVSCECGAKYSIKYTSPNTFNVIIESSHKNECQKNSRIPTIVLNYLIQSNRFQFITRNYTQFLRYVEMRFGCKINSDTFRKRVKSLFHMDDSDLVNSFKKMVSLNNLVVQNGGFSIIHTGEMNAKGEYVYLINQIIT